MNENVENVWNTNQQSLSLTISKDGTEEFYVSGEKQSAGMNDAIIVATSTGNNPEVVGSAQMTVLWVEVSVNDQGIFALDNEKRGEKNKYYNDLGIINYNNFSLGTTKVPRTINKVQISCINHWFK